jgi:hypothetical protein
MKLPDRIQLLSRRTVARGSSPATAAAAIAELRFMFERIAKQKGVSPRQLDWLKEMIDSLAAELSEALKDRAVRLHLKQAGWQFRTCGKPRCRCMRGGAPHGPYRYAYRKTDKAREPGKKKRIYSSVYQGKR